MSEFKQYRRKSVSEMRPYIEGETLFGIVSISDEDIKAGSPLKGDMIARNPKNHSDQWLVAKDYFKDNLQEIRTNDFKSRLVEEEGQLKERIEKLHDFTQGKIFEELPDYPKQLLQIQLEAMRTYWRVLAYRASNNF